MNTELLRWQMQWDKTCVNPYVTSNNPALFSKPFTYGVSKEYMTADFKLMVIGQEAAGFSAYNEPTDWDIPRTQQWVVDYTRRQLWGIRAGDAQNNRANCSPFWNFMRNFNKQGLTPSWNNVDKVYQKENSEKKRKREKVIRLTDQQRTKFNEAVCEDQTLLQREIEISKPDGIVFVTGPEYRISMETALGLSENMLMDKVPAPDRILTDISIEANLGIPCVWTYHPRHLCGMHLSLKNCAQEIAKTIKQNNK